MPAAHAAVMTATESAVRVVEALLAAGVYDVVVAPGSRSAPLAYALAAAADAGRVRLQVRIDERDAGFTALGLALGSGAPTAVITTSGTAVGMLLPAVMEASHSAVPLLVLSADRPAELRGTGANQTTNQLKIFGSFVRYDADISAGTDPTPAVTDGLLAARNAPAGPVHLNLAFRDPLTPDTAAEGRTQAAGMVPSGMPGAVMPDAGAAPGPVISDAGPPSDPVMPHAGPPRDRLPARRTVVVAGAGAGAQAEAFARALDLPLFAEPSSNARFGANAIGPYRLLLERWGSEPGVIERVVLFGRPTLSRPVSALLARTDIESGLYLPAEVAWFESGRRRETTFTTVAELAQFAGRGEPGWLADWQRAGAAAEKAIDEVLSTQPRTTGLLLARLLWQHTGGQLVLGSSNPIRDLDLAGRPQLPQDRRRGTVYANRGLAGIDGSIATATGIALANPDRPTRLLLGDLTLLHDVGGLLLGDLETVPDLQIVVLNDAGGGIFFLLEHGELGEQPRYTRTVERLFGTPQSVDISALARAYGLAHRQARTGVELEHALKAPVHGRSILEVSARRSDLRPLHAALRAAVAAAVLRLS